MRKVNWSPNKGINLKNIFKNFLWKKKKKNQQSFLKTLILKLF